MQKRLFWYPWICLAIIISTLACLSVILHMLSVYRVDPQNMPSGATLVKEAARHASF